MRIKNAFFNEPNWVRKCKRLMALLKTRQSVTCITHVPWTTQHGDEYNIPRGWVTTTPPKNLSHKSPLMSQRTFPERSEEIFLNLKIGDVRQSSPYKRCALYCPSQHYTPSTTILLWEYGAKLWLVTLFRHYVSSANQNTPFPPIRSWRANQHHEAKFVPWKISKRSLPAPKNTRFIHLTVPTFARDSGMIFNGNHWKAHSPSIYIPTPTSY